MSLDETAVDVRADVGKMEAALLALRDPVAWTDAQGTLQWCNEAFVRLTGAARRSMLGKSAAGLLPLREAGKEVPASDHPVNRCLELEADQKGRYTLPMIGAGDPGGEHVLEMEVLFQRSVQDEAGAILVIQEAGDEALHEQYRLQGLALAAAANAIAIMDRQGVVRWINPAFTRMTGYAQEEIYGRKLSVLRSGHQSPDFYKDLWRTIMSGRPWRGELVNRHKSGRDYVEYQTVTPVKDKAGRITHFISIKKDITSRKMIEHSLMESNRLLEVLRRDLEARIQERTQDLEAKSRQLLRAQKLESIGQLAAGIAHEINTPIQYLGDNIHFIQDSWDDALGMLKMLAPLAERIRTMPELAEESRALDQALEQADLEFRLVEFPKALEQSLEGIQRVVAIVQAMKRFSHVEDMTETKAVDLNKALENTMVVARNEWKYVAEVRLEPDPSLPLVTCVPGDINQVFLNVLINAAHAVGDRWGDSGQKGSIVLSTRQDGEWAEVRVQDNGMGISEEHRERIFDPFFTTKEVGRGSGQGLALVHAIMEKHGGNVDCETEVGKGTTFIIRLPITGRLMSGARA